MIYCNFVATAELHLKNNCRLRWLLHIPNAGEVDEEEFSKIMYFTIKRNLFQSGISVMDIEILPEYSKRTIFNPKYPADTTGFKYRIKVPQDGISLDSIYTVERINDIIQRCLRTIEIEERNTLFNSMIEKAENIPFRNNYYKCMFRDSKQDFNSDLKVKKEGEDLLWY